MAFQILPEDSQALEFGEMTGGKKKSRALRLMNHGRASVPVRIIISAVSDPAIMYYDIWYFV